MHSSKILTQGEKFKYVSSHSRAHLLRNFLFKINFKFSNLEKVN